MLFIHRSVGKYLINHGNLRQLLAAEGIQLDDYNNNDGLLTGADGTVSKDVIKMPGNNTNPDNLAAFFSKWSAVLDGYDVVMIKSCYPNSHIKSIEELEAIKNLYSGIIKSFSDHKKPLVILTTPPLRPIFTNPTEAKNANKLAEWLVTQAGNNLYVFDFHKLLAEPTGKNVGMLRKKYRHWLMPWDNHPNAAAHKAIAPQLVAYLAASK